MHDMRKTITRTDLETQDPVLATRQLPVIYKACWTQIPIFPLFTAILFTLSQIITGIMADPAFGMPEPMTRGASSVLGSHPSGSADSLPQAKVSTMVHPVCASFRESVPKEPSVSLPATCLASAPASRAALECLQEQMLLLQSAMQHQMSSALSPWCYQPFLKTPLKRTQLRPLLHLCLP